MGRERGLSTKHTTVVLQKSKSLPVRAHKPEGFHVGTKINMEDSDNPPFAARYTRLLPLTSDNQRLWFCLQNRRRLYIQNALR
jgi:hypothetical protein